MKLSVAFVSAAVANNIQAGTGFAPGTLEIFEFIFRAFDLFQVVE